METNDNDLDEVETKMESNIIDLNEQEFLENQEDRSSINDDLNVDISSIKSKDFTDLDQECEGNNLVKQISSEASLLDDKNISNTNGDEDEDDIPQRITRSVARLQAKLAALEGEVCKQGNNNSQNNSDSESSSCSSASSTNGENFFHYNLHKFNKLISFYTLHKFIRENRVITLVNTLQKYNILHKNIDVCFKCGKVNSYYMVLKSRSVINEIEDCLSCQDDCEWECNECFEKLNVRAGSWLQDLENINLGSILKVIYWWSYNKSIDQIQHECDELDEDDLILIIDKLSKMCLEYFHYRICEIGKPGDVIEVDFMTTAEGYSVIGGFLRHNESYFFYQIMDDLFGASEVVAAILDNVRDDVSIHIPRNSVVMEKLDSAGVKFMKRNYGIKVKIDDEVSVCRQWEILESQIKFDNEEDELTNDILKKYMFRSRMELHDNFIFTLDTIGILYEPSWD